MMLVSCVVKMVAILYFLVSPGISSGIAADDVSNVVGACDLFVPARYSCYDGNLPLHEALSGIPEKKASVMKNSQEKPQTFSLGSYTITALPNARKRPAAPPVPQQGGAPVEGVSPVAATAYCVENGDGGRALVDSGIGGGDADTDLLMAALKAAGIDPLSITAVYCSHVRPEHLGKVRYEGKPCFPNAGYYIGEMDYFKFCAGRQENEVTEFLQDAFGGQVFGHREPLPFGWMTGTPGFTKGHQSVCLNLGDAARMVFAGELVRYFPLQLERINVSTAESEDASFETNSRKWLCMEGMNEGVFVIGGHFPYPGVGRITQTGEDEGFAFTPMTEDEINAVVAECQGKWEREQGEKARIRDETPKEAKPALAKVETVAMQVTNKTRGDIWIEGDPNWDDQEVTFTPGAGKKRVVVARGKHVTAQVKWGGPADELMMGIGFASGPGEQDWYPITVGRPEGEDAMDITETFSTPSSRFTHNVTKRASDSVSIDMLEAGEDTP